MIREKLIFKIENGLIPFLPTDLDGLVFWADPTNSNFINPPSVPSSGDQISLLADRSLFSNNATQTTVTKQPTWQDNRAIEFDGSNDALDVFSIWNDLASASGFSLSMWVKTDQLTVNTSLLTFFRPNGGSHEFNRMGFFCRASGSFRFLMTNQNPSVTSNYVFIETTNPVFTIGTWSFLTINYAADGTAPKFYVDAVEVPVTDLGSTDLTKGISDLNAMQGGVLGAFNGSGGGERFYFDGQIGQVFLTKEAITEDEITELYNYSSPNY